jgi:hypothetical protein
MLAAAIVVWCLTGTASFVWLAPDRDAITWGQLVFCIALGSVTGPLVWMIIALKIFIGAEFWNKPIFGKSK